MRMFNSGLVESFLTRAGIPDDVPIESGMVSRSIESAQKQVEGRNFEIRKNVLKYDDVLNMQRTVIYKERRRVLEHADLGEELRHFASDVVEGYVRAATVGSHPEEWDLDLLWSQLRALYPVGLEPADLQAEHGNGLTTDVLVTELTTDVRLAYEAREEEMTPALMRQLERRVVLGVIDRKWREHLYEMDYLQDGIGLRAMAQRNPLVEYQREGFDMFQAMTEGIKEETVRLVFAAQLNVAAPRPPAGVEIVGDGAVAVEAAEEPAGQVPVEDAAPADAPVDGTPGRRRARRRQPGRRHPRRGAGGPWSTRTTPTRSRCPAWTSGSARCRTRRPRSTATRPGPGGPGVLRAAVPPAGRAAAQPADANRAQRRAAAKRDKRG